MLNKFFTPSEDCVCGEYFVVRTNRAGVFYGEILEITEKGERCLMKDARRIYYWDGAATLSQLSKDGVSRPENCKFPEAVENVTLFDVIEVLPLTLKAKKSLDSVKTWKE